MISSSGTDKVDFFHRMPDDLVISILGILSATASSPAEFLTVSATCKRLNELASRPFVLSRATPRMFHVRANQWSEPTHRFLKRCSNAGNAEAMYTLGVIKFCCLNDESSGKKLMFLAARKLHAPALYFLSVVYFMGSGNIARAVELCVAAAFLGHPDAHCELRHIGNGARHELTQSVIRARARCAGGTHYSMTWRESHEVHPMNRFLREWAESGRVGRDYRASLCSYERCGRPETRKFPFGRCSVCRRAKYCSLACQFHHWTRGHNKRCGAGAGTGAVFDQDVVHLVKLQIRR